MLATIIRLFRRAPPYRFDFAEARRRCRILLIDDDPNALPLEDIKKGDYNISQERLVSPELLRQCEGGVFDIIILDYNGIAPEAVTPDDGFGVFARIKGANPNQYIISISGQTYDISKTEYFQRANDWLRKPTDLATTQDKLDAGIRTVFDKSEALARLRRQLLDDGISARAVDKIISKIENSEFRELDQIANLVKNTSKVIELSKGVYSILRNIVKIHMP
jgi:CheY-like chemotaxis protein